MSDTAKRGVPVRFRIMTGGTRPADVVNLAEALSALVEPLLTPEERLRREGQGWVDDYDWGYDEEDTAAVPRDEDGGAAPVSGAAPGEDGGADPGQNLARPSRKTNSPLPRFPPLFPPTPLTQTPTTRPRREPRQEPRPRKTPTPPPRPR